MRTSTYRDEFKMFSAKTGIGELPWVPKEQHEAVQRLQNWHSVVSERYLKRSGWEIDALPIERECKRVATDASILTHEFWLSFVWHQLVLPVIKDLLKAETEEGSRFRKRRRVYLRVLISVLIKQAMKPGPGKSQRYKSYFLSLDTALAELSVNHDLTRLVPWESIRILRGRYTTRENANRLQTGN